MWCAIILGGGSGSRMGCERNKVLLDVCGRSMLCRSVAAFRPMTDEVVVVIREEDLAEARTQLAGEGLLEGVRFAMGGSTRQESVWHGLCALPGECDRVMVHDAARCLVDADTIRRVMDSVEQGGSGVAAVPCVDTIKQVDARDQVAATPERLMLRSVQTPQGFETALLRRAHLSAQESGYQGTDDASLVERLGVQVQLTMGSRRNIKLTTPEDRLMAEALLKNQATDLPTLRVGQGYDVHRLVEGRKLILCGVEVPHTLGLLGHSDADVALHALMDAMLGAMALGDIGKHFPDTDERYRGISSILLLEKVVQLLWEQHARVTNADVTIVAQKPKLLTYIPKMRQRVAEALALPLSRVNVKATTTERLGFEGEEQGISAQAVVMVQETEQPGA